MARQRCTPQNPMPQGASGQWEHEGAEPVETVSDYYQRYQCSDCGQQWEEELPE